VVEFGGLDEDELLLQFLLIYHLEKLFNAYFLVSGR
jgi:hypothetical protein